MTPTYWNVLGLLSNLSGVFLLFRYGMPYRVSQINEGSIFSDPPTAKDKALNRRYAVLGWIGLGLIFCRNSMSDHCDGIGITCAKRIGMLSQKKQIIISTHSDYILDLVPPESVFIVQNDERQGSTVKPISRVMSNRQYKALKSYLSTSGNLGEYWRHSGFES